MPELTYGDVGLLVFDILDDIIVIRLDFQFYDDLTLLGRGLSFKFILSNSFLTSTLMSSGIQFSTIPFSTVALGKTNSGSKFGLELL